MNKSVGICTMEKVENRVMNTVGSSRIRARWLLPYWPEAEEYTIGGKYETLIFQKTYWREMAEAFKGKKIFDICDPDWLEPRPVFEMISHCHAVTCSTEALAEYMRKFTDKPVVVIPDRVNLEDIRHVKQRHEGTAKSVIWFGYSQNIKYIERTFDHLAVKGLSLTIISNEMLQIPRTTLDVRFIKYRYETINEEVVKHDFVLMPQTVDTSGRLKYKSNNKSVQSWAWGMPVATSPEEIDRFMSGEERQKERDARLQEVREQYDVRRSVVEYKQLVDSIHI